MKKTCFVCKRNDWLPLPDPVSFQSVTTSSKIVSQPLGKSACKSCGLVQRVRAPFLGLSAYYEEEYATYYEKPGASIYHPKRYQELINWMQSHLIPDFSFNTVLDVGCGQGWIMDAMVSYYPNIDIYGIEPSEFNATIAERKGYKIFRGKVENISIGQKFDLIYCNNVFQHVNNPTSFLADIKALSKDNSVIIITCPDGSKPHIELLFSDHNYSFLPSNLNKIGEDAAYKTVLWDASGKNPALPPAQLLLLTNNKEYSKSDLKNYSFPNTDLEALAIKKIDYINKVKDLNDYIMEKIQGSHTVYNFGASYWTSVLAAYCTDYWEKVEACVIDNKDEVEEFMGKKVIELNEISDRENISIVLGTNPAYHKFLSQKLDGLNIVAWNNYFNY